MTDTTFTLKSLEGKKGISFRCKDIYGEERGRISVLPSDNYKVYKYELNTNTEEISDTFTKDNERYKVRKYVGKICSR
jgi:hypothetical protein